MKKLLLVLISLVFLTIVGCSSTSVESSSASDKKSYSSSQPDRDLSSGLYYQNKQTKEKLLIDDWKYKGFGNELPEWVIPALEENIPKIKKLVPELSDAELVILQAEGYNHDQAEKSLEELEKPAGFQEYENFWILVSSGTEKKATKKYISVAVYYKLIES